MMNFALWWFEQLPAFLMTAPISAFTGLAFLFVVAYLVKSLLKF